MQLPVCIKIGQLIQKSKLGEHRAHNNHISLLLYRSKRVGRKETSTRFEMVYWWTSVRVDYGVVQLSTTYGHDKKSVRIMSYYTIIAQDDQKNQYTLFHYLFTAFPAAIQALLLLSKRRFFLTLKLCHIQADFISNVYTTRFKLFLVMYQLKSFFPKCIYSTAASLH